MSSVEPQDVKLRRQAAKVPNTKDGSPTPVKEESEASLIARLVHWDDLPHWQRDNQHIRGSYRPASGSFRKSVSSLGYLHNETVNIYSHLIPSVMSIPIGIVLYRMLKPRYEAASHADVVAFSCFFFGAGLCMGMSATYHTISNHSPIVNKLGNKLDYVGIVLLITGSFVPSVYYGFWCDKKHQITYWTMIVTIGLGCAIVSVLPKTRTPEWRTFRASMFVAVGLSAVFPVLHGLKLYGLDQMNQQMGLFWVVLQGFLYILGAGLYSARIPERFKPGAFDIWGSSHQIFHFLVVLAACSHLVGLLTAFDYRHGILTPSC